MEKLKEKREDAMPAIIRHRPAQTAQLEIPYESSGLIETDDKLYEEIFSLAQKKSGILLKVITRANIKEAIKIVETKENIKFLNTHYKNKGNINLQLFIKNISIDGQKAKADVFLNVPWAGTTIHHTWILEEILKKIPDEQRGEFYVESGKICFAVNFSGKIFPEEAGINGGNQIKFIGIEKKYEQ
ncbi:MAG: hypothetical protein WC822_00395 [Candidatus Paceibacterota bacterium]|jgi:hypothetical protein